MTVPTMQQVRDVFLANGFVEAEAGGEFFRWYEYPRREKWSRPGELVAPVFIRAMYYGGRADGGDLQVWINGNTGVRPAFQASVWDGYIHTVKGLEEILEIALAARFRAAVEELVRADDERLAPIPELVAAARNPRREQRQEAEAVIADWLLATGVPF